MLIATTSLARPADAVSKECVQNQILELTAQKFGVAQVPVESIVLERSTYLNPLHWANSTAWYGFKFILTDGNTLNGRIKIIDDRDQTPGCRTAISIRFGDKYFQLFDSSGSEVFRKELTLIMPYED